MPDPQGELVSIHVFVDSDHYSEKVTRRSKTGVLILLVGPQSYDSVRIRPRFRLLHLVQNLKQ